MHHHFYALASWRQPVDVNPTNLASIPIITVSPKTATPGFERRSRTWFELLRSGPAINDCIAPLGLKRWTQEEKGSRNPFLIAELFHLKKDHFAARVEG